MLLDLVEPLHKCGKKTLALTKLDSIVGVEFENEVREKDIPASININGMPTHIGVWRYHSENSLRHWGFEWVSSPIFYSACKMEIENLFNKQREIYKQAKLPFTNSLRTSVHVHFDIGRLNTLEIVNFACLYWILEPYLQHFCGRHRQGNLFCLRLKDSSFVKMALVSSLCNRNNILCTQLSEAQFRYSSVNFNSILKFGTLEFRLMRGVSEERDAFIWIDALEAIRKYSLNFLHPADLRTWFLEKSEAKNIPLEVLGKPLVKEFSSYLPKNLSAEALIREGYLSVLQILAAAPVFSKEDAEAEKKLQKSAQKTTGSIIFTDDIPLDAISEPVVAPTNGLSGAAQDNSSNSTDTPVYDSPYYPTFEEDDEETYQHVTSTEEFSDA